MCIEGSMSVGTSDAGGLRWGAAGGAQQLGPLVILLGAPHLAEQLR